MKKKINYVTPKVDVVGLSHESIIMLSAEVTGEKANAITSGATWDEE